MVVGPLVDHSFGRLCDGVRFLDHLFLGFRLLDHFEMDFEDPGITPRQVPTIVGHKYKAFIIWNSPSAHYD